MNAVGYVRVSTNKEEQELSLENQTEFFSTYITKRGDDLVGIYSDKGKSATKMKNRKELQKMLKSAKRGEFQRLYVKDISRLFRNTLDFIMVSRQLADYGVQLHLVNMGEGKDIDTFTLNLMAMLAENESQKMSERIKFSKKMSQEKGIVPNFVFGYDRQDKYTLVPHPEESMWVQEIYRLYTEELWGMARIAKMLYEKRVKTKKLLNGEPNYNWSQTTVGQILKNEIYTGRVINGKQSTKNIYTDERINNPEDQWSIVERPEFRIITDETFNKAQEVTKANASRFQMNCPSPHDKASRRSDKHLFSNIIKCGECGFSYRRVQRSVANGSKVNAWWTCSKRSAYGSERCSAEYIRIEEEWLKYVIEGLLRKQLDDREAFFKHIEDSCNTSIQEYIKRTSGFDIDDVESELKDLREQRERLKAMAVRGMISLEEAERDILPINNEIERLTFALNHVEKTHDLTDKVKTGIKQFFDALDGYMFDNTLNNIQLKRIIQEIRVISKERLDVYFNLGEYVDSSRLPMSISFQTENDTYTEHSTQRCCGAFTEYRSVTIPQSARITY